MWSRPPLGVSDARIRAISSLRLTGLLALNRERLSV